MKIVSRALGAVSVLAFLVACDEPKPTPPPTPVATTSAAVSPKPSTPASASAAVALSAAPSASSPVVPAGPPASYDFDTAHSRVGFSVRHMMISNTRGHFGKFSGSVFIDEATPAATKISVEIETASIDTSEVKRDDHLRSAEFFDVKKFPKMTFVSTAVERAGAGYKVTGDLTLHGVTKPVVLTVDSLAPETKDPWGGFRRGAHATAKINRKDFGLTWNKGLETGGVVVGDDITIDLEIELVKKKS
jgi:polyisoprenoid-binding protein YceI